MSQDIEMQVRFAQPEIYNERWALERAIESARCSPCAKSKRGVVIWREGWPHYVTGFNSPPHPHQCDGSEACRSNCAKLCVHAEADALISLFGTNVPGPAGCDMLHVKVQQEGLAVASGEPSCWQCSRLILRARIRRVWLLQDQGLRSYGAQEFHRLTLANCGLPSLRERP